MATTTTVHTLPLARHTTKNHLIAVFGEADLPRAAGDEVIIINRIRRKGGEEEEGEKEEEEKEGKGRKKTEE